NFTTDGFNIFFGEGYGTFAQVSLTTGNSKTFYDYGGGYYLAGRGMAVIGTTVYLTRTDDVIRSIGTDGTGEANYAGVSGTDNPPSQSGTPRLNAVLSATDLATDGTNLFYIDASKLIREISAASGTVTTLAGTAGTTNVVDGVGVAAHFRTPTGLACDG